MSNRNRNDRNRWNDDRNYDDYRENDRNREWERENQRRNTSMHQGSWNERGGLHPENYGLGDTSQGSANYGHIDQNRGSRYYGTGNYGGYFGSGSEENRNMEWRGSEGQSDYYNSQKNRSYNSENYGKGPRYGNSSIHGRNYGSGSSYGSDYGAGSFKRENDFYKSDYDRDWNRRDNEKYSGYENEKSVGEWNNDRDWWDKTTDEVSSWFGDDEANRRRELDKMNGPHFGKGPKGYTRSDEKIKEDVQEKLYHDTFVDASDIDVSVSDGEVTLTGTVDTKQTKRRAEDCVERVTGVKEVSNHLKINHAASSNYSSEIGSLNKENTTPGLSGIDQKRDQSKDLKRTANNL
jgi:osmotically-inducible protein OsmY